ncbi:MAG: hypothetical protein IKZ19_08705, partial [Clostridia bacterium]|nr:hypothetical protein [Clostridia bacterium]
MDFFKVRSGNCMASVNVCPEAGETAFTAAGELCRYLGMQMGVCVNYASPVAPREGICLGYNKTDLGDDGFSFAFEENTLFIDGGKRGIIYGVFELLEKLGFRFFTAECQLIPEGTELSLQKKDISCKPVFEYRCTNWRGMNADFAPRVKINSLLGGSLPASYGGDIHYQGFVHTIGDLAEMERVDGGYTDRQPCLSDEAVYGTVVKNVRRRIEEDPSAAIVSVSQND